jgi:hypothetical protein
MPKQRKKRYSQEYVNLMQHITDLASDCVCLLNGVCLCYSRNPVEQGLQQYNLGKFGRNHATEDNSPLNPNILQKS